MSLKTNLTRLIATAVKMNEELIQIIGERTQLRAQLAKANERIAELETENATLSKEYQRRLELLQAKGDTIETLTDDLAINKNGYDVFYTRCIAAEAERDKMEATIDDIVKDHQEMYWDNERLWDEHIHLVDDLDKHKAALRPFADIWLAQEQVMVQEFTTGKHKDALRAMWRLDMGWQPPLYLAVESVKQAAALLGDDKEDGDETQKVD